MILKIRKIVEQIKDFPNSSWNKDNKLLTTNLSNGNSFSWIPILDFDGWEVVRKANKFEEIKKILEDNEE